MIIGDTTSQQDLLSIISITLLFLLQAFLQSRAASKKKEADSSNIEKTK